MCFVCSLKRQDLNKADNKRRCCYDKYGNTWLDIAKVGIFGRRGFYPRGSNRPPKNLVIYCLFESYIFSVYDKNGNSVACGVSCGFFYTMVLRTQWLNLTVLTFPCTFVLLETKSFFQWETKRFFFKLAEIFVSYLTIFQTNSRVAVAITDQTILLHDYKYVSSILSSNPYL